MFDHVVQRRLFAAPPSRHRRQQQRLTQHALRHTRQKAQQRSRLQHARAQRIGDHHTSGAYCAQQPRHTQRRIGTQFDRVAVVIVQAPQDGVYAAQTRQSFEIHRVAAHRQVMPLNQGQPQMPRQIRVLKIGFIKRTGREHHRQCLIGSRGSCQQVGAQTGKEAADGPHTQILGSLRIHTRHNLPVFQRIAWTGRRLRAITQNPPAAIRATRQIHCIQMQPSAL